MPRDLAARVSAMEVSGVRKVFDLAAQIENPINLSIGQPHFDVPPAAKAAAIEAIQAGKNAYTRTQGGPELRAALGAALAPRGFTPEEILVVSGVSGGLLLAFLALLDPGDEVLTPDPYFVSYKQLALLCGGRPVFVDTYPDFRLDAEKVAAAITPRTKALVLSSPANPTGVVYTEQELRDLAAVAAAHDLLVISDEIYQDFAYDGPPFSIASAHAQTLVLGGFSKSHAMTGWRLGWAAGPQPLIAAMTKLQQFTYVCAPSMAQLAGAAVLGHPLTDHINDYRRKRDRICAGLRDAGYEVETPGGAFYIFPRVPWGDDMAFVEAAIGEGLLIIPGSVFSEKRTHLRLSYAAEDETIDRGLEVLARLARRG